MDINQVILVGRLTRDPELTQTNSQKSVCKFSIANNKNKTEASFFDITAWEKTADICSQYLRKGSQVIISGKLVQDTWKTPEGLNRSKVSVTAFTVQFVGGKSDNQAQQQSSNIDFGDDNISADEVFK